MLIGLDDEHSWLPALLEVASNPKILPGQPGYIDCSVGIPVLEAPSRVDRAEGDLHPKGNPHYLLDPVYAKIVAQNIAAGLARNFPQHQPEFDKNLKAYSRSSTPGSVAGKNWRRLCAASNMSNTIRSGFILPIALASSGSAAWSLSRALSLRRTIWCNSCSRSSRKRLRLLIYGAQNPRIPQQLQGETGIKVLRLYTSAGGRAETDTYIKWIDYTVRSLVQAVS